MEPSENLIAFRKEKVARDFLESVVQPDLFTDSRISLRSKEAILKAADKALTSGPESLKSIAHYFKAHIDDDPDELLGDYRYDELLAWAGGKNDLTDEEYQELYQFSEANPQEPKVAEERVKEYAENNTSLLVTAALADAALEGIQINHPDAISIDKK